MAAEKKPEDPKPAPEAEKAEPELDEKELDKVAGGGRPKNWKDPEPQPRHPVS